MTTQVRSALHLRELPPKYRQLAVVGRGTTSVVLQDPDPSYVLICTKDTSKVAWLTKPLGVGLPSTSVVEQFFATAHSKIQVRGMPIVVLRVPKLLPLTRAQRRDLNDFLERLYEDYHTLPVFYQAARVPLPPNTERRVAAWQMSQLIKNQYSSFRWAKPFQRLFVFLSNHNDWELDVHVNNVMQTPSGELVVIDPTLSTDLYNFVWERQP